MQPGGYYASTDLASKYASFRARIALGVNHTRCGVALKVLVTWVAVNDSALPEFSVVLRLWMQLSTGGNQWFSQTDARGLDFLSEVPLSREAMPPCLKGPGFKIGNQRPRGPTSMLVAPRLRDCSVDASAPRSEAFSGRRLIILLMFRVGPHPRVQVWMWRRWPMRA
jgi:hypothetical protein